MSTELEDFWESRLSEASPQPCETPDLFAVVMPAGTKELVQAHASVLGVSYQTLVAAIFGHGLEYSKNQARILHGAEDAEAAKRTQPEAAPPSALIPEHFDGCPDYLECSLGRSEQLATLRAFTGWLQSEHRQVSADGIERWGSERGTDSDDPHMRFLFCYYSWLFNDGLIESNPADQIGMSRSAPGLPQPFTKQEVKALFSAASGTDDRDQWRRVVILWLWTTGSTVAETCDLRLEDIDWSSETAKVGRRRRSVPIGRCVEPLRSWVNRDRSEPDPRHGNVFHNSTGGRTTASNIHAAIEQLGHKANVQNAHPHRFRPSCEKYLREAGVSVCTISELLGDYRHTHKDECVEVTDAMLSEAVSLLPVVANEQLKLGELPRRKSLSRRDWLRPSQQSSQSPLPLSIDPTLPLDPDDR